MTLIAIQNKNFKKHENFKVEWNLGKRCNYDCSYCHIETHDNFSPHMTFDVFKNTVDKIMKSTNKKVRIALTGGEPYIIPDFIEMIKYAKDVGVFNISVVTNGTAPMTKYEKSFDYIDSFTISYHFEYAKKEKFLNKVITFSRELSLHRVSMNIKNARDLIIHIMFLPGHLEQAKNAISLFEENNIQYVIRRIRPQKDPNSLSWLKPYSSGMTGVWSKKYIPFIKDSYYSQEEIDWMTNA